MKLKTKPEKLTALLPADELGARFCQWFSHPWHWIYAETPEPGEKAQWFTETRYPLRSRNLWQEYLDPEKIIGLRFDNYETRYCSIDIDRGSPYHPANDRDRFKAVLAALEEIGLCRPLLVRSSDSEGIHIYYFLPEAAPTFALACAIKFALEDAGCYLRSGHLEAFPNCKPYSKGIPTDYNGHRLPLQVGSYWLDDDGLPLGDDLAQFLDAADVAAANQDIATLRRAIAAAGKNRRRLQYTAGMSSRAAEWKRHLEERIAEGWTGRGQTNELLLDFATHGIVFLGLSDDALIDYIVETAQAAPGYKQWCGHQHHIRRRARDWAKSAQKWYVPYRGYPKRDRSYQEHFGELNNIVRFENSASVSRRQEAADRIQQAIAHLETNDMLPPSATARAAAVITTVKELFGTGMSLTTLHKPYHLPLWHPEHKKSPEPAQGELLHVVPETTPPVESPEPAQGELLHVNSLYEGLGADEGQPHAHSVQGVAPIPPLEISSTPLQPSEVDGGCSRRDPSTDDCHNDCHTPTDRESGVGSRESAVTPPAASGWSVPSGADERTIRRLIKIRLDAMAHAKRAVKAQESIERRLFAPSERERREIAAKMEFFWRSGESELMDDVRRWLAADPTRKLNLESS